MPLTPSEELVARLARRTFLSMWSDTNPIVRPGKELCDLVIVCDPDVIVVSVKEVTLGQSGNVEVDSQRWRKRAVDESIKQIYGAERWLNGAKAVIRSDRTPGLILPPTDRRRTHRVAVALGGRGEVPFEQGDFGKGFVHVLAEDSLECVMGELDTVSDFVAYLSAKEKLMCSRSTPLKFREADLLAIYVHAGRQFNVASDVELVVEDSWKELTSKSEWSRRKAADEESYIWDSLIETLIELTGVPESTGAQDLASREAAFRAMAREDRFSRRVLAGAFNEFMAEAARKRVRARLSRSPSGVVYVFMAGPLGEPRDARSQELALRCFVARGMADHFPALDESAPSTVNTRQPHGTVVGLATERYKPGQGFSLDAVLLEIPEWTAAHQRKADGIKRDLGYFVSPRLSSNRVDEYPEA
jgi:hypothetical protein